MRYVPLYCKAEPGSASSQSRPTVLKEMISPLAGVTVPVSLAAKQRPGGKKDETTSACAAMRALGDWSKSASHEGRRERPFLAVCQTDPLVWRLEFQTGWIRRVQCYSRGMPRSTESHG